MANGGSGPPVAATPRRKKGTALTSSQTKTAWLLLLPTLLLVAFVALYPLVQTIYCQLHQ